MIGIKWGLLDQTLVSEARTAADIADELDAVGAALAKQDLLVFAKRVWPIIEPEQDFKPNWHIDLICRDLEALERGDCLREVFNIPPGTMKSLLVSVIFPAWVWARNPHVRFLKASYSSHLSVRDNIKLRDIVQSSWYQSHYDVTLVVDQNQKTKFETTEGGWSVATSVGGAGTGEHPDYVLIDDPLTAEQARSAAERDNVNNWFDQTVSTRGVIRDVRCGVVMQRLHQDDLSGHLEARGGWKVLRLPMRYEPGRTPTPTDQGVLAEPRDPRRVPGALLWPDAFPEAKVRKLELDLGPYGTAGQLQQRPAPEGGGLFKREWFKFVDAAPVVARRARGWDTASTEGGGDWTCGVKIAEAGDLFYVEDVVREQLSPAGVDAIIKQTAEADTTKCVQREEKEGGSAGAMVVGARLKMLKGYDYKPVQISGDKVTRSKPFRAQVEGGNVFLVRGPWNELYIRELCDFPTGKNDDQVDGSSCAFNAVLLEPVPQEEYFTW